MFEMLATTVAQEVTKVAVDVQETGP